MPTIKSIKGTSRTNNILLTIVFSALLLAGGAVYGVSRFGSSAALIAALQGRVLHVETARIRIEPLKPGATSIVKVRIRNLATGSIKVLGSRAQPSCGCLIAKDLPTEFAPGEVKEVPIQIRAPTSGADEFVFVVSFYTNVAGEQPQVLLHGHVLSAGAESGKPTNEG